MKLEWLFCWPGTAAVAALSVRRGISERSIRKMSIREMSIREMSISSSARRGKDGVTASIVAQHQPNQQQEETRWRQRQEERIRQPKHSPSSRDDRALVWSAKDAHCSADTRTMLNLWLPATICSETDIQWDKDGILTAKYYHYLSVYGGLFTEEGSLYQGYYYEKMCQNFSGCVITVNGTEDTVDFPGQYAYDCGNVYCGPNAARACNGTYYDNQCSADVDKNSLPDIPLLRNVNCEFYHGLIAKTEHAAACGACEKDEMANATVSITCEPDCRSCDGNDNCDLVQEQIIFSEHQRFENTCVSVADGPVACIVKTYPAQYGVYAAPSLFNCSASVADAPCASCKICGFKSDGAGPTATGKYAPADILYQADCTNIDKVSKYDDCVDAFTGVFAPFGRELNNSTCPDQQPVLGMPMMIVPPATTAPVQLVTVPVTSPKTTTSAPGSMVQPPSLSPVAAAPVPEATTVTSPVAVGTPVASPVAAPVLAPVSAPVTTVGAPLPVAVGAPAAGPPAQPQPLSSSGKKANASILGTSTVAVAVLGLCLWAGLY
jgi:hypothetical protein